EQGGLVVSQRARQHLVEQRTVPEQSAAEGRPKRFGRLLDFLASGRKLVVIDALKFRGLPVDLVQESLKVSLPRNLKLLLLLDGQSANQIDRGDLLLQNVELVGVQPPSIEVLFEQLECLAPLGLSIAVRIVLSAIAGTGRTLLKLCALRLACERRSA